MSNILLVGKPNSGKSLLFNRLTGLNQASSNFPGVTVEVKEGSFGEDHLIDFPGIYSINTLSKDEEIALEKFRQALGQESTSLVLCTLDATKIERSLIFGLQAQALAHRYQKGFIFVLNLIDELEQHKHNIDTNKLSQELGSVVIPISARKLKGLELLKKTIKQASFNSADFIPKVKRENSEDSLSLAKKLGIKFGIKADIVLKRQNFIDNFLLSRHLGVVLFLLLMFLLFQSIFTWASPLMDLLEQGLLLIASLSTKHFESSYIKDFIQDALFGGLGSFLVFVPQIMILSLIIGFLEDSGYLARAALICHKPLSLFGLSGKSFIPYLTGHACAIPAIYASRTIESPKKRLITMLTIPLLSCSARLPVYALLISVIFPRQSYLGGLINLQGIIFFLCYFFGIMMALLVSLLISKSKQVRSNNDLPFILELPPYRLPHWRPLLIKVINSAKNFIKNAGPIIFMVSIIIWFLGYFPNPELGLETSYLAKIGKFLEPLFRPLGLDWRYGVAILASFLAREVFVSTLGTILALNVSNVSGDDGLLQLSQTIQSEHLDFGTGLGLLLFYIVALQCISTVAVLRTETGSKKLPIAVFIGYSLLAYLLAFFVNKVF